MLKERMDGRSTALRAAGRRLRTDAACAQRRGTDAGRPGRKRFPAIENHPRYREFSMRLPARLARGLLSARAFVFPAGCGGAPKATVVKCPSRGLKGRGPHGGLTGLTRQRTATHRIPAEPQNVARQRLSPARRDLRWRSGPAARVELTGMPGVPVKSG